jgi:eukaryotic-like serine/threonine-protein kinase
MSDHPAVFLSYSHKDNKRWLDELRTMLAPLVRNGVVDVWWDGKIKPSQEWREEIDGALASARVGVLLVSPNFLASDFIAENELPYLIEAAKKRGVKLIWVLLSACFYEQTPLRDIQAAHEIDRPLDTLGKAKRNAVLKAICQRIAEAAKPEEPSGGGSGSSRGPEPPARTDRGSAERPDPEPLRRMAEQEPSPAPSHQRLLARWRWLLAAVAGLALVALLTVHWILRPAPSVALLGFRNLSGDPGVDFVEAMLLSLLSQHLRAGSKLSLVSDDTVARVERELRLFKAQRFSSETIERLHENLPADVVVFGSYRTPPGRPGQVEVTVDVQEAPSGETVATFSETGSEQDPSPMIDRLGSRLRAALGAGELSPAEARGVRKSWPGKAARFYAEGLGWWRISDALNARRCFEKAVAAEPEYPLARLGLAKALQKLGYDPEATEQAKRANADSSGLPLEDKLQVEAQYREIARQWDRAIGIYRELDRLSPNKLEYGLRLANAQTKAGQGEEARSTIESLRTLPSGEDPRLDLAEVAATESASRRLELAKTAEEKGLRQKAYLLAAQALSEQGKAYLSMKENQKALVVFKRARQIYDEVSDDAALAGTLGDEGEIFFAQGNYGEARQRFERALKIFQDLGDLDGEAWQLNDIAAVLDRQRGEKTTAIELWERASRIYNELGRESDAINPLNNMALSLAEQGKLTDARQRYEEVLSVCRSTHNRREEGVALGNLADVLHSQGELVEAKEMFDRALAIERDLDNAGEPHDSPDVLLTDMARLLAAQGATDQALRKLKEVLDSPFDPQDKGAIAEGQLAIASLYMEKGDPGRARTNAEQAIEQFHAEAQTDDEAEARAVLARALAAQGALEKAGEEISAAERLAAKSQSYELRITVQLAAGLVRAATGEIAEARRLLAGVRDETLSTGYAGLELEARLELGRLEAERGDRAQGRALLAAVEKDARDKGFLHIASEARR